MFYRPMSYYHMAGMPYMAPGMMPGMMMAPGMLP